MSATAGPELNPSAEDLSFYDASYEYCVLDALGRLSEDRRGATPPVECVGCSMQARNTADDITEIIRPGSCLQTVDEFDWHAPEPTI